MKIAKDDWVVFAQGRYAVSFGRVERQPGTGGSPRSATVCGYGRIALSRILLVTKDRGEAERLHDQLNELVAERARRLDNIEAEIQRERSALLAPYRETVSAD